MKQNVNINIIFLICLILGIGLCPLKFYAGTAGEINASVDAALNRFIKHVRGAREYLGAARGILIIPEVKQVGFIVGGEYGEGCLRVGGKIIGYYNIISGSVGPQIGAQEKDIILLFMDEAALKKFRSSKNWQAGVDGTVTLITIGAEGSLDTSKINQPIVGFVSGQKGLMAGAMIEGSKFSRIKK